MIILICSELLFMSSCYMTNYLTTRDSLYTLTWTRSIIQAVQLYSEKEKLRETATGTVEMEECPFFFPSSKTQNGLNLRANSIQFKFAWSKLYYCPWFYVFCVEGNYPSRVVNKMHSMIKKSECWLCRQVLRTPSDIREHTRRHLINPNSGKCSANGFSLF